MPQTEKDATLTLDRQALEDLVNILSSYGEYASDKLDVMRQWDCEYTPEDVANVERLRQASNDLFPVVVQAFSDAVAAAVEIDS